MVRKRAKELGKGVKATRASGAVWYEKGDISSDDVLIEHKYTTKKSFSITRRLIEKVRKEARARNWCIEVEFLDEFMRPRDKVSISSPGLWERSLGTICLCKSCKLQFTVHERLSEIFCPKCKEKVQ